MCDPMYPAPPVTRTLIDAETSTQNARCVQGRVGPGTQQKPSERELLGRRRRGGRSAGRSLEGAIASAGLTTGAADGGHVITIAAHDLTALAAGVAGLVD